MFIPFERTLESLKRDRHGLSSVATLGTALFASAWIGWCVWGRVTVYELSTSSRVEVTGASHALGAPVAGRISKFLVEVGKTVDEGELLVELDHGVLLGEIAEQKVSREAAVVQIQAISKEIEELGRARQSRVTAGSMGILEARARVMELEAAAGAAEKLAERTDRLRAEGLSSEMDVIRARADAVQKRQAARSGRATVGKVDAEGLVNLADRDAAVRTLERLRVSLEGQIHAADAAMSRLRSDVSLRQVRSPISGRIGAVSFLRVGAVAAQGEKLVVVVPNRESRVVAYFPAETSGRLRQGQVARFRAHAFPWTEYGSVRASVLAVAGELWGGEVRVELELRPDSSSRVPTDHGLTGTVEVEVERASPLSIVLRSAGQALRRPQAPRPSPSADKP